MQKIEISRKNVLAAYKVADENGKKLLDALFGQNSMAPSIDDYRTIKSYEDACVVLGITPIHTRAETDKETVVETRVNQFLVPSHLVALYKLETVSRALWGPSFRPKPDAREKMRYYYPWFCLFKEEEIEIGRMADDLRESILPVKVEDGNAAGFGFLAARCHAQFSFSSFGFRLLQETEEKAEYFGKTFVRLWAEFLAFEFRVSVDPIRFR